MTIELNDTKDDCETFGFMGIVFRNVMSWLLAIILFIGMVIFLVVMIATGGI